MDNKVVIRKEGFNKDPSTVKFKFLEGSKEHSGFIVLFQKKYYALRLPIRVSSIMTRPAS